MKKFLKVAVPLLATSFIFAGCQQSQDNAAGAEEASEKITVQATIFPIVDFTERIGGEFVEVTSVFPAGSDSHTYEPTQQQMVEIARSDLFIYNGAGTEAFADTVIPALANEGTTIVAASEGITLIEGSHDHDHSHSHSHSHDEDSDHDHDHAHDEDEDYDHDHGHGHSHGDLDPHIWLDPIRAISMAENILNALVEQQPENEEYFQANFEELKADLEELDAAFQEGIENSELNTILVSHAAYGYWTERFGLNQLAVAGLSTTDEPSQQELTEIIHTAREYNIDTILFETTSSPRVAQVVQQELDLNVLYLNHLSTITAEDVEEGRDYFDLMYANLEILMEVLNPKYVDKDTASV